MIDKREILEQASTLGLLPSIVEKDYVLGWLLAGIDAHPVLSKTWVFKGGTCLKKCYFETYRFSEDLDFTLKDEQQLNEPFLRTTLTEVVTWVADASGLVLPADQIGVDLYTNPRGRASCQGRIGYRGPVSPTSGGWPKIKLDLTADHQLPVLPPVADFWSELPSIFAWIGSGAEAPQRAPIAAGGGEITIRDRVLPISIPASARSPLEIIRFAAANRLCVDLGYEGSTRRIEPYSLRQTREGNYVLHAIRSESGQHRSYRVDRIVGASATNQTFSPKYLVELMPGGPLPIAPVTATRTPAGFRTVRSAWRAPGGPVYVYRCPACNKTFERRSMDSKLNPHKDKHGHTCPGRIGYYETTR